MAPHSVVPERELELRANTQRVLRLLMGGGGSACMIKGWASEGVRAHARWGGAGGLDSPSLVIGGGFWVGLNPEPGGEVRKGGVGEVGGGGGENNLYVQ